MRYFIFIVLSIFWTRSFATVSCEQERAESISDILAANCTPTPCVVYEGYKECRTYTGPQIKYGPYNDWAGCYMTIIIDKEDVTNNPPQFPPSHEEYVSDQYFVVSKCANTPKPPSDPAGPAGSGNGGSAGGNAGGNSPGGCPTAGSTGSMVKYGSVVKLESQSLLEMIPIQGTSFTLNYYSGFQVGRVIDRKINVELTGDSARDYITSFVVENRRDGVLLASTTFPNASNQAYQYTWNGLDASNVDVIDSAKFELAVSEVSPAGTFIGGHSITLSQFRALKVGLGGWLPSNLMHYDVQSKRLYSANGDFRSVSAVAYGSSQLLISSENRGEVYIFDSNGNHLYTKSGMLGTTILTFSYDSTGKLSSITEPFGKVTTFNRNTAGDLTSISAPTGQVTNVVLDGSGYIQSVENANSEEYLVSYYGTQGLMHTFQKPNGEINSFVFDSEGRITKDSHSGGYFFDLVKTLNPDYLFDVTATTVLGRSSNVRTNIEQSGSVSQTYVDSFGVQYNSQYGISGTNYSRTDSGGGMSVTINSSSDARFGEMAKSVNQIRVTPANGSMREVSISESVSLQNSLDPFSISSWSKTISLSGANSSLNTSFDPLLNKFSSTTYLGKASETTIDSYERPVSFKMGSLNQINLNYTNENLTSIVQGTRTTSLGYNSLGLLESMTNPLSQTTSYVYNSANRLTSKIFPDSRVVGFTYDGVGNLTGVTPPGRPLHSFGINAHGLVGSYAPPALSGVSSVNTTYSYNLDKQITAVTRPSGDSISFNYNAMTGVLESLDTSAGNFPYGMDSTTGLLTSISTPANVYTYMAYVGRTPSSTSTSVNGTSVGNYYMTYGSQNLVDSDSVVSGGSGSTTSTIAYLYNDDEDLKKAGDVSLTYNTPNGQLTGTTMGSGTTGFTDTYTYNTYGEVTGYTAKRGTTTIYDLVLTRDGAGRVSGKTQTMNSTTNDYVYGFDSSGRLQQVTKNSVVASNYGYDSNSNRNSGNIGAQTTTASYDDQDRLLTYNTLSFTYNANGDMLTKTNSTTSTTTQYTYDVFGNLTQVVLPGGTTTITYEIDGLNRRIGKKVNGVVQKRWVYMDQYRIAAELNSSGTITKRFIYGSKGNIPDYMIASGVKYRIISDQLGSPRLVVKQSDGTITQRMDHDEFGRIIEDTNPGYLPFGFAGGLYDNQTGIVRFGARDYDPEIGRWMSKDPIRFEAGDLNLYSYVLHDPVNHIDMTGNNAIAIGAGRIIIGIVSSAISNMCLGDIFSKDVPKKAGCAEQIRVKRLRCEGLREVHDGSQGKCYQELYELIATCRD